MTDRIPTSEPASAVMTTPLHEEALESELIRKARAARWWKHDWPNKPITIWLLSTFVVGIFTFAYANYQTCRTSVETDSSRFSRLFEELTFRAAPLLVFSQYHEAQQTNVDHVSRARPPEYHFGYFLSLFSDPLYTNEDKAPSEEQREIDRLRVILNPSELYLFSEFRGRFPHELTYEGRGLIKKMASCRICATGGS